MMNKYALMVFIGACCYGVPSTFVKIAIQKGYTASEISFLQAFIGMIVLWSLSLIQNKKNNSYIKEESLNSKSLLFLLLTGICIGLTTFLYYLSVTYIPASLSIIILMQFTWIGILLDWLIFKKKPKPVQLIITLIIIGGTIMASGLISSGFKSISWKGIVCVLGASILYAIYIVMNTGLAKQIPPLKKSAIVMTGSVIGILIVNLHSFIINNNFDFYLIKLVCFLALMGTIIPPILFTKGMPKIGAGTSAILMTVELPVAVIIAHLVLKEPVTIGQWIGIVIMLFAISFMNILKIKRSK